MCVPCQVEKQWGEKCRPCTVGKILTNWHFKKAFLRILIFLKNCNIFVPFFIFSKNHAKNDFQKNHLKPLCTPIWLRSQLASQSSFKELNSSSSFGLKSTRKRGCCLLCAQFTGKFNLSQHSFRLLLPTSLFFPEFRGLCFWDHCMHFRVAAVYQ